MAIETRRYFGNLAAFSGIGSEPVTAAVSSPHSHIFWVRMEPLARDHEEGLLRFPAIPIFPSITDL